MKGLLSVSFGTSFAETREKTIDVVDRLLTEAFSDRAFYSAWTSGIIIRKVRTERGEEHDTLAEALERLAADGVDDLVVATMCLMDGKEMAKIRAAVAQWAQEDSNRTARLAEPLLATEADCQVVAAAVLDEFTDVPEDEALLLMGHGSPYASNEVYVTVEQKLHELGRERFFVATVEGTPTFDDGLAAVEACGTKHVHLAPFMIVAGDHARNDLAGDDDDSWKCELEARGFQTDVRLKGLGEYPGIQELVVGHAQAAREVAAGEGA